MTLARARSVVPASRSGNVNLAITALLIVILFSLLGPLMSGDRLNTPAGGGDDSGSLVRQFSYLIAFVVAVMASGAGTNLRRLLVLPSSMTVLLAWCWLSLLWAFDPAVAFKRLVLTTMIIWSIFLIVKELGLERSLRIMGIALLLMLAANVFVCLVIPSVGVHQSWDGEPLIAGSWRGISGHKNAAGPVAAYLIMYLVFYSGRIVLFLRLLILVIAAFFLWMTQSKTSISLLFLSLLCGGLYLMFDRKGRVWIGPLLLILVVLVAVLGHSQIAEFSEQFSRPDGFTGRTQIWPALWAFWQDHWLGAGFGSFWGVGSDSPIFTYARGWVVSIYSGHNGYLDLLVQVGPPGLFFAVLAVFLIPIWRLITSPLPSPSQGALLLASIVFPIGQNMTESTLMERDLIVQIFIIFTVALVGVATSAPKPAPLGAADQLESRGLSRRMNSYKRAAR